MVSLGYNLTHHVQKEIWPTVPESSTVNEEYWGKICSSWVKHGLCLGGHCLTLCYSHKLKEEVPIFDPLMIYFAQFALMLVFSANIVLNSAKKTPEIIYLFYSYFPALFTKHVITCLGWNSCPASTHVQVCFITGLYWAETMVPRMHIQIINREMIQPKFNSLKYI